ncbi:MAG: dicarboxylate/amino acid:cation symporter [Rickettsiales bacterium]|nr:dicarboxylate/amino acid:cation symporter [Rickettsiales bacterium]
MITSFFKRPIWQQVFIAMLLGFLFGLLISYEPVKDVLGGAYDSIINVLKAMSNFFVRLIKMLIVPLVFFSIAAAVSNLHGNQSIGKISSKVFVLYLVSTAFAISLSLSISGLFFNNIPEENKTAIKTMISEMSTDEDNKKYQDLLKHSETKVDSFSLNGLIVQIVPSNPFQAFVEGNILQVIIFAIMIGIAIQMMKKKAGEIASLLQMISELMAQLVTIVMYVAPFGIFGIIAWLTATQTSDLLSMLFKLIAAAYLISLTHSLFVYGSMIKLLTRLNPVHFFVKLLPVQAMAFSTSSSSATLPLTMQVAENQLGVSKPVSSFSLPLGTTINMDGTAIYLGVVVVFLAEILGHDLTSTEYMTIILTSTLASIGTAGVPGAGMIMLSLVLVSINFPLEGVAIVLGIDRILDMMRTAVNVTGDAAVALITDKSEDKLDVDVYHSRENIPN